jgi:outer membrane immunogenic protein
LHISSAGSALSKEIDSVRKDLTVAPAMALLIISTGSSLAADLPSKKEAFLPPPPPPPIWSGFYAGLNAGYNFGANGTVYSSPAISSFNASENGPLLTGDSLNGILGLSSLAANAGLVNVNQNGFIGGGQVGYNYQWGPSFVIGIEADIQGAGIRGSGQSVGAGVASVTADNTTATATSVGTNRINAGVDWLGTVRGRIGYLFTPTLLIYATGGLSYGGAYANVTNYSTTSLSFSYAKPEILVLDLMSNSSGGSTHTFVGGGQRSQTLVGWNAGGGLEWMFMPNWSVKAEAFYWNLGNMNVPTAGFAAAPVPNAYFGAAGQPASTYGVTRVNYAGVVARAGVNYHFNWGSLLH